MNKDLNDEELKDLYVWISSIKLSKPIKNISRDFSDGVLTAEVMKHFFPKLVDLHNYTPANATQQKLNNWKTLNIKVFSKLNFHVPDDTLNVIVISNPGYIEKVLWTIKETLENKDQAQSSNSDPDSLLEENEQAPWTLQKTLENSKAYPIVKKELSNEALQELYTWIDNMKLSKTKKYISRDFSDGVMIAEVVKLYFPKLVDLFNYTPATSIQRKRNNWQTLNRKVFSKLGFYVPDDILKNIVLSTPGYIEMVLCVLQEKLEGYTTMTVLEGIQESGYCNIAQKENQNIHHLSQEAPDINAQKFRTPILPSSDVRDKEQHLLILQETLEILQTKIVKLEHLIQKKDLHIADLTKQLQYYQADLTKQLQYYQAHNNIS